MRVLIVEDEAASLRLLTLYLESKGHVVIDACNGREALEKFKTTSPDIVLLDVRIPSPDGWAVLEAIRVRSKIPVIMLTALDSTEDAVKGLTLGADDYLRKPFQFTELEARINAVLRRVQEKDKPFLVLKAGSCWIDENIKTVILNGKIMPFSPKEYDLFKLLAKNPGHVISTPEILTQLWPSPTRADANDVKQYIYLIRNKIRDLAESSHCIETVKGFGYRLLCYQCHLQPEREQHKGVSK